MFIKAETKVCFTDEESDALWNIRKEFQKIKCNGIRCTECPLRLDQNERHLCIPVLIASIHSNGCLNKVEDVENR